VSVNWSKKEFASKLVQHVRFASELQIGDIVFEDGNPIGVAKVVVGSRIQIYDCDDNGWEYASEKLVFIVPREMLRTT
jgi:hypothetical protein